MVEEARLESVYTSKGYHGFESRSLRKIKACDIAGFFAERFSHPWVVPFGHASRARSESRSLRSLKDSRFRLSSFVYMCALSQNKGNPFGLPFLFALLHHIFLAVADIEARTGSSDALA